MSSAPQNSQNVISRLESKYSDILDRVAKRKEKQRQQQQQEDRDKTLEPDGARMPAPLMKSATTANIMKSSLSSVHQPKERTPFRVERNRNKYHVAGTSGDLGRRIFLKFLKFQKNPQKFSS